MSMGHHIHEFIHFHEDQYREEVANYSEDELRHLHKIIKQKVVGARASAGFGSASSFVFGPGTLFGVGVSWRRIVVNQKRLKIIEERLKQQDWKGHEWRKRDLLKPLAISSVAALVIAPGADVGVAHLAPHAASGAAATLHAAASSSANHGIAALEQVAHHPEAFVMHLGHGISGQVSETVHHIVQNSANGDWSTAISLQGASSLGYAAGETVAKFSEGQVVELTSGQVVEDASFHEVKPKKH